MSVQTNQPMKSTGSRIGRRLQLMLLFVGLVPMIVLLATLLSAQFQFEAIVGAMVCSIPWLDHWRKIVGDIVRQSNAINQTFMAINRGDFEARADQVTNDELGATALALNSLCDSRLNMTQSDEDRDQIEASIESLIAEMKAIAAGDLTITTAVNDDMTGSIADSVNHMTKQLRSIVGQVQSAAEEVSKSAVCIREASTTTFKDSEFQALRINDASEQLLDMTESFQNVAESTQESAQVALEARQTASNGLKAVSDTVDGMQRIRNQVQSTSKRIKRLGESSQEIGEIVQMISDIADRTSILALNASIQALMAGDAGHGFAVVAEEIECLAERSTTATKEIAKLIRAIQNETSEVMADMEESTREVVAGSQLASQAGETLFEIDSVSNQLVDLIQNSSNSAWQQAERAAEIANSMTEVSLSTKESADRSREATRSVSRLAAMVSQLRNSVSQFRVSNDYELIANPWRELSEAKVSSNDQTAEQLSDSTEKEMIVQKSRNAFRTVSLEDQPQPEKAKISSRSTKPGSAEPQRKVKRTVMIEERPEVRTSTATELTDEEIDSKLLRQVREATVYLDEGDDSDKDPNKSSGQDRSRNSAAKAINLDDV